MPAMKTPTTLLLITALTSAVNAQLQQSNILEGPIAGRLWIAPVAAATELAPPLPHLGEPGEFIRLGALPEPRCQAGQGGRPVCLLRLISPGAEAYRLHFESVHLAPGSRMYVYGLDAAGKPTTVFGPYEEAGPNADGGFRSRIAPGVAAVVEIQGEINGSWPFALE